MATIINASNSTGLTLTSDLSGVLQLQQNGVALPALSIVPAFSVYLSTSQSITSGVTTKAQFNTKDFDTANCFDATTNYRYTPTVAGYYQINATLRVNAVSGSPNSCEVVLYKNGSQYTNLCALNNSLGSATIISGSCIVYLNGSTDYIEIYGDINGTTTSFGGGATNGSRFSGSLIRGA